MSILSARIICTVGTRIMCNRMAYIISGVTSNAASVSRTQQHKTNLVGRGLKTKWRKNCAFSIGYGGCEGIGRSHKLQCKLGLLALYQM